MIEEQFINKSNITNDDAINYQGVYELENVLMAFCSTKLNAAILMQDIDSITKSIIEMNN